jgi:Mat/Ecp fimbriae outer membrane usher protein
VFKKNYAFWLLCFFTGCVFADELILKASDKPPVGFEDLSAVQESSVDVYFGDKKIADAMATFSPTQFEFKTPLTVVKAIPDLKKSEENAILKALTGNLEQNPALICQKPNQPQGCGQLKPTVAGIIFDAGRFKVVLFVNPTSLEVIHLSDNPYIPFPETKEFSFIQNLAGGFASSNQTLNFNIRTRGILSYYLTRLRYNLYATEKGFQMNSAAIETEWRDTDALLGMFRSQATSLLGQQEVLGVRVATSFKQRTDLRTAFGNELVVFLPQRALVKTFRDNQLLSSQRLEVGNQTIDTSYFPDGAYNVDIVIEEDSGSSRAEHYFFSKSMMMPPLNNPIYVAELGVRKKVVNNLSPIPQYTTVPLLHLATARRLNDYFGYDTDLLYSNKEGFGTLGFSFLYSHINLRLAGLASNTGYGAEFRTNLQFDNFNSTVNLHKSWQNNSALLQEDSLSFNPFTQADMSMGYIFPHGISVNIRSQWRENNSVNNIKSSQYTINPFVTAPLFQYQGFRADVNLSYALNSQDQLGMFTLRLQQNTRNGLSISNQAQASYQPVQENQRTGFNNNNLNANSNQAQADYQSTQESQRIGFNNNLNINWQDNQQGFVNKQVALNWRSLMDSQAIRLTGEYRDISWGASGFAEHLLPNQGKATTSYGAQFVSNVIGDEEGMSFGGSQIGESAIMVDLLGSPKGAGFDVLASRMAKLPGSENKIANAYVGANNITALEPYETYQIRIAPHKTTFAHYEDKIYNITLYPATVARLVWKVDQTFTVIALVMRPDGSLVKNAKLEGAFEPASTDDQGLLQADVSTENKLMLKPKTEPACQIEVPPDLQPKNGIVVLEKLLCK